MAKDRLQAVVDFPCQIRNLIKSGLAALTTRPDQTRPDYVNNNSIASSTMEVSMQITNISEAKASLSSLIKMVQETDKPVIIGKAGEPVAILSAYKKDTAPRVLGGSWEGKVKISDAFDEVDEEISDGFYNSPLLPNKS